MRVVWKVSLILAFFLLAIGLYFFQKEFTWIQAIFAILGTVGLLFQLSGISFRDLFRRKGRLPGASEITLERRYRHGPIEEERIQFVGTAAIRKYVDGVSMVLLGQSVPADEAIAKAGKLVKDGSYAEADVKASDAIKRLESFDVENPLLLLIQAYSIKGDAAFNRKLFVEAEKYYTLSREIATLINDNFIMNIVASGIAAAKASQGNHPQALEILEQILRSYPSFADAWYNRGLSLDKLGKYEQALASYEEAIRLNPKRTEALNNKGVILGNLGKHEQALAAFEEAIRLDPKQVEACYNKGVALGYLGKYEQALASYEEAIRLNPKLTEAWYNRGTVLDQLAKYEQALASYEEAIRLDPKQVQACYNKGVALGHLGKHEQALAAFEEAIRLDPKNVRAWNNKGAALGHLGRYEQALVAFEEAIRLNPKQVAAWSNKAIALDILGRHDEAIEAVDQALHISPNDGAAKYLKQLIERETRPE